MHGTFQPKSKSQFLFRRMCWKLLVSENNWFSPRECEKCDNRCNILWNVNTFRKLISQINMDVRFQKFENHERITCRGSALKINFPISLPVQPCLGTPFDALLPVMCSTVEQNKVVLHVSLHVCFTLWFRNFSKSAFCFFLKIYST